MRPRARRFAAGWGVCGPVQLWVNLKSLVVYLPVYQHVSVERCVAPIGDLTGGTGTSAGFVRGMLTRRASAVRPVVTLIRT